MSKRRLTFPWLALSLTVFMIPGLAQAGSHKEHRTDAGSLQGKEVAFLITEGFHDGETLFPMGYLLNRGAKITVIGIKPGAYKAYNSDVTVHVEKSVTEVSKDDFHALVIPGGRSPDTLRKNEAVVAFVKDFFHTDKPTAAICHGPQVLVTAGVIKNRTLTGFPDIKNEISGAGGTFKDVEVHIDGNLITSRIPDDLPAFSRAIERLLLK